MCGCSIRQNDGFVLEQLNMLDTIRKQIMKVKFRKSLAHRHVCLNRDILNCDILWYDEPISKGSALGIMMLTCCRASTSDEEKGSYS